MPKTEATAEVARSIDRKKLGQIVLVLQGGGALGAYQAGVYQALQEVGIEPDWVIGTSIGAINASLIAGNPPEMRLERLREFWLRVRQKPFAQMLGTAPFLGPWAANALTISAGVCGFFEPNPWAFAGNSNCRQCADDFGGRLRVLRTKSMGVCWHASSYRGGARWLLLHAPTRTHAREIDRRKPS